MTPFDPQAALVLRIDEAHVPRLRRRGPLAGVPPARVRAARLHRAYHDTKDRALGRAGLALAVCRSGEPREGAEQLVTQGGQVVAVAPLAEPRPSVDRIADPELRERIKARLAGDALEPAFEAVVYRTCYPLADAGLIACLDVGALRTPDASEPRFELLLYPDPERGADSEPEALALALLDEVGLRLETRGEPERGDVLRTGAPWDARRLPRIQLPAGAPLDALIAAITEQCGARVRANLAAARDGRDPEGVHHVRVGLRQLRSAIRLFGPVLPAEPAGHLRAEARWLASCLGDARDLDVFAEGLRESAYRRAAPAAGLDALERGAQRERAHAYRRAAAALDSERATRLLLELALWQRRRGWRAQYVSAQSARLFQPAEDFLAEVLEHQAERMRGKFRRPARLRPRRRHRLRIAVKRLRYGVDFARSVFPADAVAPYLEPLRELQDALGHLNDVAVADGVLDRILARLGPEAGAPVQRAGGFRLGWLAARAERHLEAASAQWKAWRRAPRFWRGGDA